MTQLTTRNDGEFEPRQTASRAADDGYFGWTDRYGVRAAFVASPRRPYFIANY